MRGLGLFCFGRIVVSRACDQARSQVSEEGSNAAKRDAGEFAFLLFLRHSVEAPPRS